MPASTTSCLTFNLLGRAKLQRLVALARRVRLSVTLDNAVVASELDAAMREAGLVLPVLIECDTGAERCGVQTPEEAVELARLVGGLNGLRLDGLMTYPARGQVAVTDAWLAEAVAGLATAGIEPRVVSTGGTPDLFRAHEVKAATEHRPGTYIYHDRDQARASLGLEDCAMRILATVVSRPTDGRAILDAGSKTLSSDLNGLEGYGLITEYPQAGPGQVQRGAWPCRLLGQQCAPPHRRAGDRHPQPRLRGHQPARRGVRRARRPGRARARGRGAGPGAVGQPRPLPWIAAGVMLPAIGVAERHAGRSRRGCGPWTSTAGCMNSASVNTARRSAPTTSTAMCCAGLSGDDLKELGVTSLGHRKKLLEAIASLDTAAPASAAKPPQLARRDAERRQLTVMFVDLVGSTALSARLDPEDMSEVLRAYQNAVTGEIVALRGARGQAHGRRRAGLFRLAARARGRGRAGGAGRAGDRRGGGAADAAAARRWPAGSASPPGWWWSATWSARAPPRRRRWSATRPTSPPGCRAWPSPGRWWSPRRTRRLLGELFELRALGPQALKGVAGPVAGLRRPGERALESRFAARRGEGVAPLVGRDQELALLLERWRQARSGEGQLVLLTGEAGIGKSRIDRGGDRGGGGRAALPDPLPVLALPCRIRRCIRRSSTSTHAAGLGRGRDTPSDGWTGSRRCSRRAGQVGGAAAAAGGAARAGRHRALRRLDPDAAAAPRPDAGGPGRPARPASPPASRCCGWSRTRTGSTRPRWS